MNTQPPRNPALIIVGGLTVGGGLLLVMLGIVRLQSAQSQLSRVFGGTDELGFGLLGLGAIAVLGGLFFLGFGLMTSPSGTPHRYKQPPPPPTVLPPISTIPDHIYYFCHGNVVTGPLALVDIRLLYTARVLTRETYVHRTGDSRWRLLTSFPEISQ